MASRSLTPEEKEEHAYTLWCNAVIWNKEEYSHLSMKGMVSSIAITWIGWTAETSGADNWSVSSRDQLDLAAGLTINGCDRGSNPHSHTLGQDTITAVHSHGPPPPRGPPLVP